jgi:hypothetical protein
MQFTQAMAVTATLSVMLAEKTDSKADKPGDGVHLMLLFSAPDPGGG